MLPSGLGVKVDVVDLVTSVVVSGEDNGANENLLSIGVEVLPAELENVRQVIADSLGAEDAVRDVDAEHDAVFVLLHGRDVARPNLQLVLRNHVAVARVVVIPVHHHHLESIHDTPEEDVVEMNAVPVSHPLVPLQADGYGHGRSIVGVF